MVLLAAIKVTLRPHAVEQHPDTAPLTRDCIQKNGIWKVYQEPRPTDNVFHWLCKDPATGTIFDMVVEKINESLYKERTSFEPKGGKWDTIFRWLEGLAGANGKIRQAVRLNL